MTVDQLLISHLPLFCDLPDDAQALLSSSAQIKRFPVPQLIMAHHTTPAFVIVVLRGQLQKTEVAEDGRITGICFVNPGEVLDWLSVIDAAPIVLSVSTTQETELLLIPMNVVRQLLREHSSLAISVLQQLAHDLRKNIEQRQMLTLPNAFQRIFVQIVHLADQSADSKSANLPKQHEIAAMVNTSRETVSRAIQMLVKNGILVKHGHRFVVQHSDQLKQLAAAGTQSAPAASQIEKH